MNGTWTRGRHAETDLSRKFSLGAGHQSGHFFVPHLDELDLPLRSCERRDEAPNPIAGIAVDPPASPLPEPLPDEIRNVCHAPTCYSNSSNRRRARHTASSGSNLDSTAALSLRCAATQGQARVRRDLSTRSTFRSFG